MRKLTSIFLILLSSNFGYGQFSPPKKILSSPGNVPNDVKLYDLDNDNDLDVLVSFYSSGLLGWYENIGNQEFYPIINIIDDQLNSANSVYAEDVDLDGDLDVIASSRNQNKILWYENIGNGTFNSPTIISHLIQGPTKVRAADVDNDGDFDIVVGCIWSNLVWFENLGLGQIDTNINQISTTTRNINIEIVDIDNDGDQDILSSIENTDDIVWYENTGIGVFDTIPDNIADNTQIWGGTSVNYTDLDNDGDQDVVYSSKNDNKIAWHKNLGGGVIDTIQNVISDSLKWAEFIFPSDIDNDGNIDVVAVSPYDNEVVWHQNLGGGVFSGEIVLSKSAEDALKVDVGDIDNDNDMDIIYVGGSSNKVSWFENLGGGVFDTIQKNIAVGAEGAHWVASGDFNNDGLMDALSGTSGDNSVAIMTNLGNGIFSYPTILTDTAHFVYSVVSGDLDADNNMDVVYTSSGDNTIGWFKNMGNGNFSAPIFISKNALNAHEAFLADLDGDMDLDVLLAGSATINPLVWFENLGNGNIDTTTRIIDAGPFRSGGVFASDLDGDLDMDVLSVFYQDGTVVWYQNLGGGNFGPRQVISSNAYRPMSVFAGDLDNDGDQDVVSSSELDDKIAWHENLGGGVFGSEVIINVRDPDSNYLNATNGDMDFPREIILADLNSDGNLDVIACSTGDDKIAFYENLGGGNFSNQNIIYNNAKGPFRIHAEDIDNDGDLDVMSATSDDNTIAWYENYNYFPKYSGKVFYDANQNGVYDSGELRLKNIQCNLLLNGAISYTDSNGVYNFSVDTGFYTIGYQPFQYWSLTSDSVTYNRKYAFNDPLVNNLDFGFYPDTNLAILKPDITGGFPRCNDTINYWLNVSNYGPLPSNGIFHLLLDDSVTYVSSDILPDSINGKNYYWSFNNLLYNENYEVNLQVKMPPFTSMNDTLKSILNIHKLDSFNNIVSVISDTLRQVSVCAYDPNDKNVDPVGFTSKGYIPNNQSLEYLIRFQNTGNDTAITVMIRDELDVNLNWSSLQLINSSHNLQYWIEQDGEVVFKFENIMLPDSGADFNGSQGFVKFVIYPDTNLPSLTPIYNFASIFFDANPPVITNTTLNTIYDCDNTYLILNDIEFCEGEELIAFAGEQFQYNTYLWKLDTLTISTTDSLNWVTDSVGGFNLTLTASNPVCNKDTTVMILINEIPQVNITNFNPDTLCDNGSLVSLPIGTPSGGNYSGNGINGGNFNPASAGIGTHQIVYTYTDSNSCINSDTTVVIVESCVGISEQPNDFGILIYPNPNTGLFTIEKPKGLNEEVKVKLLDATSKLILDKIILQEKQQLEIDIINYSNGVYYLQLIVGKEVFVKQILKN